MFEVGKCQIPNLLNEIKQNQAWLSEKTGISNNQISDYANNRYVMSMKTAKIISHVIGCSINDLYEWVPEKNR